jgi:hypothetical protein
MHQDCARENARAGVDNIYIRKNGVDGVAVRDGENVASGLTDAVGEKEAASVGDELTGGVLVKEEVTKGLRLNDCDA